MRKDITVRETLVVAPLIALLIFFGFYPKPLLDVINPAVTATMHDIGKTDPTPSAQVQEAGK
jgi:NADH-quinone oxidoreductase subunit M